MNIIDKIIHTSNAYYNEGLERAKIRDLTGAMISLRNSLKYYKMNIPARNLLGLVYFEMGETVEALSQWVISRNLCPQNNPAERYLEAINSNKTQLDTINQTIKKYNQALTYCQNGSKDLALIQLKKVVTMNPKLVKAHQLLALLYMEEGRHDLAKRHLRAAGRIDANNVTTLRYLREVNRQLHGDHPNRRDARRDNEELVAYKSGNDTIIRPATFKDNTVFTTIINIVIGVVIGVLITVFLVLPGVRKAAVDKANATVRAANETISTRNQTIKALEDEIQRLEESLSQSQGNTDAGLTTIGVYEQLLKIYDTYASGKVEAAGDALAELDPAGINESSMEIYNEIAGKINEEYIKLRYDRGIKYISEGFYTKSVEDLISVVSRDPKYNGGDALFQLTSTLRRLERVEEALEYCAMIIELYPESEQAASARTYVSENKE